MGTSRLGCSKMKGHPHDALPEADARLPVGADQRDVVNALVWIFA